MNKKELKLSQNMIDEITMLLKKEYIIMLSCKSEYLFFSNPKTGAIGYWQSEKSFLEGANYTTTYKPNKKYGTGKRVNNDIKALNQHKKRDYWEDIFEFYNQYWNKDKTVLIKGTIDNIKIIKGEITR